MLALPTRRIRFSDGLLEALRTIEDDQLETGEIPNYRRLENGVWEYYFSPLVSAYVADALGVFDPLSHLFDPFVVERAGEQRRFEVSRTAARIRRRIHRFVTWQQSDDGGWRFLGRGSPLPPDRETTACCALTLLDRVSVYNDASTVRAERVLQRLRARDCLYSEADWPGAQCSLGQDESQLAWPAWIADVNMLRLTILVGGEAEPLSVELSQRCQESGTTQQSVPVLYALARAWQQCDLTLFDGFIPTWIDSLVGLQTSEGSFGSQLTTAMGLTALLNLGHDGKAVASAASWLSTSANSPWETQTEPLCNTLCGSPTLTTAVSISALARAFS